MKRTVEKVTVIRYELSADEHEQALRKDFERRGVVFPDDHELVFHGDGRITVACRYSDGVKEANLAHQEESDGE